jgi:diguanylate cyclase (GGDEF)-like protein
VRAANNDGVWNEQGLAVGVRATPAPWRTWWAYAAYVLAFGAAVFAVIRAQRRKMAREVEYRRRLEVEVEARTLELGKQNDLLERLNQQLVEVSLTDSLTGLKNRRYLFEEVGKELGLVRRQHHEREAGGFGPSEQLLFMMVDLDWFKPINDTCGHDAGDRVLLQVKQVLEKACRTSDVLIRWGGDEFLVVGRARDLDGVEALPERVRRMIERTAFDLGDGQIAHITCSIGFTCYPARVSDLHAVTLEQVVTLADRALYAAKKAGRNAWVGLLGTAGATAERLARWLPEEPEELLSADCFEVRRSSDAPATRMEVDAEWCEEPRSVA